MMENLARWVSLGLDGVGEGFWNNFWGEFWEDFGDDFGANFRVNFGVNFWRACGTTAEILASFFSAFALLT
jgi:hypothetical protein